MAVAAGETAECAVNPGTRHKRGRIGPSARCKRGPGRFDNSDDIIAVGIDWPRDDALRMASTQLVHSGTDGSSLLPHPSAGFYSQTGLRISEYLLNITKVSLRSSGFPS
jgi:hypothetical protein